MFAAALLHDFDACTGIEVHNLVAGVAQCSHSYSSAFRLQMVESLHRAAVLLKTRWHKQV